MHLIVSAQKGIFKCSYQLQHKLTNSEKTLTEIAHHTPGYPPRIIQKFISFAERTNIEFIRSGAPEALVTKTQTLALPTFPKYYSVPTSFNCFSLIP